MKKVIKNIMMLAVVIVGINIFPVTAFAYGGESASENSAQNGDNQAPSLNASINNGKLKVRAFDESGIKVIYVNNYQFFDPQDGILSIRLEKFEAGIEYFTISAMDNNGNRSEEYKLKNPYWTDPNADKQNNTNPADSLPADASATDPGNAIGEVIEHVETDENGYIIEEPESYYTGENDPANGREFYTIQTENGKVFYLIVEKNEDTEIVHFVTDITENDLLNTTTNNSEVLPKNSLAGDSNIPVSEVSIPTEDGNTIFVDSNGNKTVKDAEGKNIEEDSSSLSDNEAKKTIEKKEIKGTNPIIICLIIGVPVFIFAFYVKVIKPKKKDQFAYDEDAEETKEDEKYVDDGEINSQPMNDFAREVSDQDFIDNYDPTEDGGDDE